MDVCRRVFVYMYLNKYSYSCTRDIVCNSDEYKVVNVFQTGTTFKVGTFKVGTCNMQQISVTCPVFLLFLLNIRIITDCNIFLTTVHINRATVYS